MDSSPPAKHFILIHGLAHGVWCWYKVVAPLRAAGHRVTALDMAASGVHPARLEEVASFEDYSRPLLEAVAAAPDCERLWSATASAASASPSPWRGSRGRSPPPCS
jgi:alpha-beta hydrolase superfamily lysophospholipase